MTASRLAAPWIKRRAALCAIILIVCVGWIGSWRGNSDGIQTDFRSESSESSPSSPPIELFDGFQSFCDSPIGTGLLAGLKHLIKIERGDIHSIKPILWCDYGDSEEVVLVVQFEYMDSEQWCICILRKRNHFSKPYWRFAHHHTETGIVGLHFEPSRTEVVDFIKHWCSFIWLNPRLQPHPTRTGAVHCVICHNVWISSKEFKDTDIIRFTEHVSGTPLDN